MYPHEAEEMTERLQERLGSLVTFHKFSFTNKGGGTGLSDWDHLNEQYLGPVCEGQIRKIWYDYETGIRMRVVPLPECTELIEYLDRNAAKGYYSDDIEDRTLHGTEYDLGVSEFDILK